MTDEAVLRRVAAAFARKWDGRWDLAVRDGRFYNRSASDWPSEVFEVTPARACAHDKADPREATTHRFGELRRRGGLG